MLDYETNIQKQYSGLLSNICLSSNFVLREQQYNVSLRHLALLRPYCASELPEDLVKMHILIQYIWMGLRVCNSNKLLGDGDAIGLQITL